jgi:AcrR family transcriptional regulator
LGTALYPWVALEQRDGGNLRRLPPGSHGIPADVVARNQRERLVAAIAEVCAERGYAETSVAGIAKRAGVSSVTFYRQFADRRDCMLAAHRQLLGRLLEELDRAREGVSGPAARARAALRAALAALAADPPSARLLTVEILAAGPEGSQLHDAMAAAFAERLGVDWVRAAGLLALIGKLAVAGEADRLPALEGELATALSSQG